MAKGLNEAFRLLKMFSVLIWVVGLFVKIH